MSIIKKSNKLVEYLHEGYRLRANEKVECIDDYINKVCHWLYVKSRDNDTGLQNLLFPVSQVNIGKEALPEEQRKVSYRKLEIIISILVDMKHSKEIKVNNVISVIALFVSIVSLVIKIK